MTSNQSDFEQLQRAIAAEKEQRLKEHQDEIAALPLSFLEDPERPLNLVAQGDSWFDYKLPLFSPSDIISQLKRLKTKRPTILRLANAGEAVQNMLGYKKINELKEALNEGANGRFDAILFSGGGNDFAGDQFRLWLNEASAVANDPAHAQNTKRVDALFAIILAGYQDLIEARNAYNLAHGKNIPIFAHSYDFAIPNNIGVCGAGPWLRPSLYDRGWKDDANNRLIVRTLLERFHVMLEGLASDPANNFVHIKTQGTIQSDAEWDNELHPTLQGFTRMTELFLGALRSKFPGRI
ncbi:SGNH/GDSL hydrolase family protein [Acidovorax soli]|uniref:SGNH/GDSL hydrolase family protein n=1 Tax=Acidovorax soli TaxID=592050 RepID=UPI0032B14430